jgi:hypothetical protein
MKYLQRLFLLLAATTWLFGTTVSAQVDRSSEAYNTGYAIGTVLGNLLVWGFLAALCCIPVVIVVGVIIFFTRKQKKTATQK